MGRDTIKHTKAGKRTNDEDADLADCQLAFV